jgi:hypothetical protein
MWLHFVLKIAVLSGPTDAFLIQKFSQSEEYASMLVCVPYVCTRGVGVGGGGGYTAVRVWRVRCLFLDPARTFPLIVLPNHRLAI